MNYALSIFNSRTFPIFTKCGVEDSKVRATIIA